MACVTEVCERSVVALIASKVRFNGGLPPGTRRPQRSDSHRIAADQGQSNSLRKSPSPITSSLHPKGCEPEGQLRTVSPAATLDRGYAIVLNQTHHVIRTAAEVSQGELLTLRLADGQVPVTVNRRDSVTRSGRTISARKQCRTNKLATSLRSSSINSRQATTLEESLALWERGEQLVAICEQWLNNARERIKAVRRQSAANND